MTSGQPAPRISEADLRRWMTELGPRLIAVSAGICRDRHQAEEIVQEAFIKLWKSPPDAGEIAVASWMRRVVTNLSINALQRTKRPGPIPEFSADRALRSGDRPADECGDREDFQRVRTALDKLDPAKRSILMLRAFEQLSYDEIAEHLEIPIGTVMSRLNRARIALTEEMERAGAEPAEPAPQVFPFRKYRHA
jgi:RNA polymerase sigma-70 factor (ECF subfamily)